MTYTQAYQRLQEIYTLLESDTLIDVEEIVHLQQEAKECYDYCMSKIKKSEET